MDTSELQTWLAHDPVFQRLAMLLRDTPNTWLVGGTIRDALIGRPICDLDLAVAGGSLRLGRVLAHAFEAAYYPLDEPRGVCRIILPGHQYHIDVADLRAPDINSDLIARDFTVNALAVPINRPFEILDPTSGLKDLEHRILRAASQRTFLDDPLRIWRLARQGLSLAFGIDETTRQLVAPALHLLNDVAVERIRDELALLLALPDAAAGLAQLCELGVVTNLAQRLGLQLPSGNLLAPLVQLERAFADGLLGYLGQWRRQIEVDWAKELASGRARYVTFRLAALMVNLQLDVDITELSARLRLSTREGRHLLHALAACRQLTGGIYPGAVLDRYLYFRRYGAAGLDGALLAAVSYNLPDVAQQVINSLFEAWYTRHAIEVAPPVLLTGNDLKSLGITPGPGMGEVIDLLRQAQVQEVVSTPEEARTFILRMIGEQQPPV